MLFPIRIFLMGLCLLLAAAPANAAEQTPAAGAEFFENKIRPLFVDHCYKCHGPQKHKGSLRLDHREHLLKGGDSGPAIVPGKADASLLIKAVTGQDKELKMPPAQEGDLTAAQVRDLTAWINLGAPYPASTGVAPVSVPITGDLYVEAKKFWSLQPIKAAAAPAVKQSQWPRSPIDAFVLATLEQKGLAPSTPADKRTLLRRATYDLTGLPPSPEEIDAFVADRSPDAFAKVVDRLLASPHYGEHWGRHWLDVARYGDTRWVGAAEDRRLPFAYTYRDWVVSALNRDVPYDQFVTLQLAADQTPGAKKDDLAALGFLTVGKWFTGNMHDVIDDQIDVVTRGLMGLTAQCARCHDHKYDPIPTKDYYSLYGLFAASRMPVEGTGMLADLPQLGAAPADAATEAKITAQRQRIDQIIRDRQQKIAGEHRPVEKIVEHLLAAQTVFAKPDKDIRDFAKSLNLDESVFMRWTRILKRTAKDPQPIWGPWHAFAALSPEEFASKADSTLKAENTKKLNKNVAPLLATAPKSQADLAARYAQLFLKFDKPEQLSEREDEDIRQILRGNDSPVQLPLNELTSYFSKAELQEVTELRRAMLGQLAALSPEADQYLQFRAEWTPLQKEVSDFLEQRRKAIPAEARSPEKVVDCLLAAEEGRDNDELRLKSIAKKYKVSERMLARWIAFLKTNAAAFETAPKSLAEVTQRFTTHVAKSGKDAADAARQIALVTTINPDQAEDFFTQKDYDELKNKEGKLLRLLNDHAGATASAMAQRETSRGYAQKVFVRGNPNVLGPDVPQTFLTVLRTKDSQKFEAGKGRLQLAQSIVDPANPLTARVMVNRVWQQHFGTGLVATSSDFGIRGEAPSHPALLDFLAHQFIQEGWSLKKLHRQILLSATWQQSSQDNPAARQVDPENRLLWRANRHRLSFEEIRDSLLVAAGRLDGTLGGRSEDLVKTGARRRTLYGTIDRTNLPGFYRYFDFPGADAHVASRYETIIPQQALFMMNNTFVMDQAWHLARRAQNPADPIITLYRLALGRAPTPDEITLATRFLTDASPTIEPAPPGPWQYGFGMYDPSVNRTAQFEPFAHYLNNTWRASAQENDPLLGRISLNARGGVAGPDRARSVIRRWIAPADATVSIVASLGLQANSLAPSGEGVRGRIVSSRAGQLGVWIVHGTEEPTNLPDVPVKAGDTIDFVVEGRGSENTGAFTWAPVIKLDFTPLPSPNAKINAAAPKTFWDSTRDFAQTPGNRRFFGQLERLAQVLLESNEFLFLD